MIETADFLADMIDDGSDRFATEPPTKLADAHGCHACGQKTPDVDVWATHPETLEQIRLCAACGDW